MELEIKIDDGYCVPKEFIINDIKADHSDFGDKDDENPDDAEEYGCGDMVFIGKQATPEILEKYKISLSEYKQIVEILEDKLSFGSCGNCI